MDSNVSTSIDVQVTGTANISDLLLNILTSFASLYNSQWFMAAIIVAFFCGQLTHAVLRSFIPKMPDFNKALLIWGVQLVVGYFATYKLLDGDADVEKYAWITGINSIAIYYLLLWVSVRWFKMPRFAKFLTLRETTVNEQGEIDFGKTIQFIRGKDER